MNAIFSRDNSLLLVGGRHYEFRTHPGQTDKGTSRNCALCDLSYSHPISCGGFIPRCTGAHQIGGRYGFWKEVP